jgi:hypothetical protein
MESLLDALATGLEDFAGQAYTCGPFLRQYLNRLILNHPT